MADLAALCAQRISGRSGRCEDGLPAQDIWSTESRTYREEEPGTAGCLPCPRGVASGVKATARAAQAATSELHCNVDSVLTAE